MARRSRRGCGADDRQVKTDQEGAGRAIGIPYGSHLLTARCGQNNAWMQAARMVDPATKYLQTILHRRISGFVLALDKRSRGDESPCCAHRRRRAGDGGRRADAAQGGNGDPVEEDLDSPRGADLTLHPMEELISIGEFSQHSGLSPKRLRSYASAGLLIPAAVDAASGYRYYSLGQLRNARLIDALREAGMSLGDIASFLRRPRQDDLDRWAQRVVLDAERRQEAVGLARKLVAMEVHEARVDQEVRRGERSMATMRMAARTDIRRVRESNEDMVLTSERLAAVADGMGGHPGGEVAAVAAVSAIRAAFTGRSVDELLAGVRAANFAIWDRARTSPDLEGMGTTICGASDFPCGPSLTLCATLVANSSLRIRHSPSQPAVIRSR